MKLCPAREQHVHRRRKGWTKLRVVQYVECPQDAHQSRRRAKCNAIYLLTRSRAEHHQPERATTVLRPLSISPLLLPSPPRLLWEPARKPRFISYSLTLSCVHANTLRDSRRCPLTYNRNQHAVALFFGCLTASGECIIGPKRLRHTGSSRLETVETLKGG